MQDELHLLFPTPIYQCFDVITEEENSKICSHVFDVKDTVNGQGEVIWSSGNKSPQNSFQVNIDNSVFQPLLANVLKKVHEYAMHYGSEEEYSIDNWWYNSYGKGAYQEYHTHADCVFSAAYFAKAPQGSSPLTFRSPSQSNVMVKNAKTKGINSMSHSFEPVERSLVIFRSHLLHMVRPGDNIDDRVSIAFDFR